MRQNLQKSSPVLLQVRPWWRCDVCVCVCVCVVCVVCAFLEKRSTLYANRFGQKIFLHKLLKLFSPTYPTHQRPSHPFVDALCSQKAPKYEFLQLHLQFRHFLTGLQHCHIYMDMGHHTSRDVSSEVGLDGALLSSRTCARLRMR